MGIATSAIVATRTAIAANDGDMITASGVTSGLDLALWIVEQEKGREAAAEVAAEIVHQRDERIWRGVGPLSSLS